MKFNSVCAPEFCQFSEDVSPTRYARTIRIPWTRSLRSFQADLGCRALHPVLFCAVKLLSCCRSIYWKAGYLHRGRTEHRQEGGDEIA